MKVGDLVMSLKGNTCLILRVQRWNEGLYYDVQWLNTGIVRTGLNRRYLWKVISESR